LLLVCHVTRSLVLYTCQMYIVLAFSGAAGVYEFLPHVGVTVSSQPLPVSLHRANRYHEVFPVQVNVGVRLAPGWALGGDTSVLVGAAPVVMNQDTLLGTQFCPSLLAQAIQR